MESTNDIKVHNIIWLIKYNINWSSNQRRAMASYKKIGMQDPIIIRYKLTTNMYSYLLEYSQSHVNNTYNTL